ncbi:MAG: acyl-CoA dehydratase activase [Desulfobacterales bacterium]
MTWYGGIDVGSVSTKMVLLKDGELAAFKKISSGSNFKEAADSIFSEILTACGLSAGDITSITATGSGASRAGFAHQRLGDLTCCAAGVHHLFNGVRTIIEVGGQASKVLRINDKGKIINFVVSEKCAAGSGRFLQVIARVLQIRLEDAGRLSLDSENPVSFTTSCAVFGESEAISRVAEGTSKEDILAGVHEALARKLSTLTDRVTLQPPCAMVGGGALDIGLVKRTERVLGIELVRPEHPQIINALGAALNAREAVS